MGSVFVTRLIQLTLQIKHWSVAKYLLLTMVHSVWTSIVLYFDLFTYLIQRMAIWWMKTVIFVFIRSFWSLFFNSLNYRLYFIGYMKMKKIKLYLGNFTYFSLNCRFGEFSLRGIVVLPILILYRGLLWNDCNEIKYLFSTYISTTDE